MTHCDRVLALLSDGEPHHHHELYSLNVIAHSRISDLRKRGHTIEMWREDDLYFYRLIDSATEPNGSLPPATTVAATGAVADAEDVNASASVAEQLRLVA